MINIFEVNETNKMIEKENLDVRTITLGISLLAARRFGVATSLESPSISPHEVRTAGATCTTEIFFFVFNGAFTVNTFSLSSRSFNAPTGQ